MVTRNKNHLDGQVFERLTVIEQAERSKHGHVRWRCLCSCGKEVVTTSSNLLYGKVKSCGCYNRDAKKTKEHQKGLGSGWDAICEYCGKPFRCVSVKKKYCSDSCSFLARCEQKSNGCIEWQGNLNNQGYGVIRASINGEPRKMVQAHRYAWYRSHGDIPDGFCLCHKCDNRSCVNVEHLFLGTWADNNRDRSVKGRSGSRIFTAEDKKKYSERFRGENSATARLTEKDVREIRKLHGTMPRQAIADKFGVSVGTLKNIWSGRNWRHVKDENDLST